MLCRRWRSGNQLLSHMWQGVYCRYVLFWFWGFACAVGTVRGSFANDAASSEKRTHWGHLSVIFRKAIRSIKVVVHKYTEVRRSKFLGCFQVSESNQLSRSLWAWMVRGPERTLCRRLHRSFLLWPCDSISGSAALLHLSFPSYQSFPNVTTRAISAASLNSVSVKCRAWLLQPIIALLLTKRCYKTPQAA